MKDNAPKCACGKRTNHYTEVCAGCQIEANITARLNGKPEPFSGAEEPNAYMNAIKHERVAGMMK